MWFLVTSMPPVLPHHSLLTTWCITIKYILIVMKYISNNIVSGIRRYAATISTPSIWCISLNLRAVKAVYMQIKLSVLGESLLLLAINLLLDFIIYNSWLLVCFTMIYLCNLLKCSFCQCASLHAGLDLLFYLVQGFR